MPKVSYKDFLKENYSIEELLSEEIIEGVLSKEKISKRNSFPDRDIPGIKCNDNDITKLISEHKYLCGYLRNPHKFEGVFTGICAVYDLRVCKYPRILVNPYKNDCPIYLGLERILTEKKNE
ncbi:hypothetical protein M0R72_03820 [Candidatus Pacearchaeota archaeon]|jgi:hypothetical protein|nr:hypothetical protein [Candidatus Pacearchaeota archaeon]